MRFITFLQFSCARSIWKNKQPAQPPWRGPNAAASVASA